jgi:hypothetical protein
MKKCISILFFALTLSNFSIAQNDAEGCKDHPLLTRLENFYIDQCINNYSELQLITNNSKKEVKEGNLFSNYYRYNFDAGVKAKSPLQIIRN